MFFNFYKKTLLKTCIKTLNCRRFQPLLFCAIIHAKDILPPDIVACNTLSQFRRQLKTFLFRQFYLSVLLS